MTHKIFIFTAILASASAGLLPAAPIVHAAPLVHAAPVAHYAPVAHAAQVAHYTHAAPVAHLAPVVHAAPVAHYAPVAHAAPVVAEAYAPPHYDFGYSVSDPHSGDSKSQQESRVNDVVHGSYSLIDADGLKRTVEYTADDHNGFNAVVHREPLAYSSPVDRYLH